MKRISFGILVCLLLTSCATYSTLKYTGSDAITDKEGFVQKTANDDIKVLAQIRSGEGEWRDIAVVKLKIMNDSTKLISITPADIRLVDADKFLIKMVSPEDAVRIAQGDVVPTLIVNTYQQGNYPNYSINAYSQKTGNISGTITPVNSSGGGFAGSFNQAFNQGAAQAAAMAPYYRNLEISNNIKEAYKKAINLGEIPPGTGIQGNVYFYAPKDQKMPFALTISTVGGEVSFEFDK